MSEYRVIVESVICDPSLGVAEGFERCENEYTATVSERGGLMRLLYEETSEGGPIKSDITIAEGHVRVRRTGAIESDFMFAEGEVTKSLYKIPPYSFDASITTKKIRNNLTRSGGKLTIIYDMNVGGADKNVRMSITLAEAVV
ncbi:MAG: DUF1934 domain-containing protein [Clostridia bacterium]|nr:DUF1934 domain-containing protein [Clostridia bacterium]